VNPTAGGGRAGRLVWWLRDRLGAFPDAELRVTARAGEAQQLAREGTAGGARRVVAVGGDGTVQEVANGLLDAGGGGALGIVPVGTGNDLARSLALPADAGEAWRVAIGPQTAATDVGRARNAEGRERWFVSAGGIGFDAQVAAAMASSRGRRATRAAYLLTTLAELRRFENRRVRIAFDDEALERKVLLVAIANGAYYGGGMRIAPDAKADDGLLDICVVGDVSRLTALLQLPNLYRGTHVRHPAVTMRTTRTVSIDGDGVMPAHLDGEPFGHLPLRVELVRGRLEVAVGGQSGSIATPAAS